MSAPYSEGRSLKRLPQLLDVKINLPIATDVLKYDAVDENWVNGPAGGGGSATTVDVTDNDTNATFYPTYVSTDGVAQPLYCDKGATSWTINPNTGDFSFLNASGNTIDITGSATARTCVGWGAGNTAQANQATAIGNLAGNTGQLTQATAVGSNAGQTTQGAQAVAVGMAAGGTTQQTAAVAVGNNAGNASQGGAAVAIGNLAGQTNQSPSNVAVGDSAGNLTQGEECVAIGHNAGSGNQSAGAGFAVAVGAQAGTDTQGPSATAIGYNAGNRTQGSGSTAIGANAAPTGQPVRQICINSGGLAFNGANANACYINSLAGIAHGIGVGVVFFNSTTKELSYSTT